MRIKSLKSAGLLSGAIIALSVSGGVSAQQQDAPPPVDAAPPPQAAGGQAIVVNAPPPPADLTGLEKGPDVEGIITARRGDRIQITGADQANTVIAISQATEVRGRGGFLGLNRTALTAHSLLNGLPVTVETVNWNGTLVGKSIRLRNDDLKTANMIRNGTAQGFAEQTAATAALRSRVGNIDQYNVRRTTNVYFDTGKWNLSPQAEAELCATATEANSTENALLLVVGYTDAVGSEEVNQTLSERRAGRVVNYLQQKCRWAPYRMLTPSGMAEADPAADNSTAEGRRQNRRVSVSILVSKAVEGL